MSRKVTTRGHVEDGALRIHHEGDFRAALGQFKGIVRITVEKDTRSLQQNSLYWLWNSIAGKEKGYTPEEIHEINKQECNAIHKSWLDGATGKVRDRAIPQSTAKLSVDAFAEYMEKVQRFWAEQGVSLPDSEEYWNELQTPGRL